MNAQDSKNGLQLLWARLKIEGSFLPTFPRFRATLTLLLFLGLVGLSYGHIWDLNRSNQGLSLTLSAIAWLGALAITLLQQSISRLKTALAQMLSIVLLVLLAAACFVAYRIFFGQSRFDDTIRYVWLIGTVLLGFIFVRSIAASIGKFLFGYNPNSRYPGLFTSPILFGLLILNYIWWQWPIIMTWIR